MARPPGQQTLSDLIVAQARRTPEAEAIRQWDACLTYRELVGAASALSQSLRAAGIGPGRRVGVCAGRTLLLPVLALGVMLAGAAYVPLDPVHPRRRLQYIIEDADIGVVVADDTGLALLDGLSVKIVSSSIDGAAWPPPSGTTAAHEAYVLYTSGSTGRPKGVAVSHHCVVAFITATAERFGLDASCRSIAFSALGFDVSVLDMWTPLTRGAAVQLIGDEDRVDPARLQRFLEEHEVTWGFIPPAVLPLLAPERLLHLRDLITVGEPPGPEQVERWSSPPSRHFHNWYGPTETTVCVVGTELTGRWREPLPIGHPLPGCRAYVIEGELYIGGPQVAIGYVGRPGHTAERFVPDPFGPPGARLYRTGDRAEWRPDGRLAYAGRLDRQVKIRGQRVEIGEVESMLRAHPGVLHAVVDVPPGSGDLIAYVTPEDAPTVAALRDHCSERLPGHMLPTRVTPLAALPLNASGKVDLAALRALGDSRAPRSRAPLSPSEQRIAGIWAQVLEGPEPDRDADFFTSGGDSLQAMRLVSAVRAELGRELAVEDVHAARTPAALAERIDRAPPTRDEPRGGAPPSLSPAQHRMWFVEQLAPGTSAHNIAFAERLRGPLNHVALASALAAVLARHQVLRWRVATASGRPRAEITPAAEASLPVEEITESELDGQLADEARVPFDLSQGPLLRARLFRLAPDDHVLAFTVHHVVFDGWSQDVLYTDLAAAYRGDRLERPEVGFADYVAWSRERAGAHAEEHLSWWKRHLTGAPTILDLPRDDPRPPVQTFDGAAHHAEAGLGLGNQVSALAKRLGATPYAVLLAAFGEQLRRISGRSDLIVGTPYADRGHRSFEPLIGCFLQILPLRLRPVAGQDFGRQVRRCHDELRNAVAHADTPLDRIVDALGTPRDLSRNPIVQMLFNMYNFAQPRLRLPGLHAEPVRAGLPGSLFDLTLYASERGDGGLSFQLVRNPGLYSADRATALLAGYVQLLEELVAAPDRPVGQASARGPGCALPTGSEPLPRWNGPSTLTSVRRRAAEAPTAIAAEGTGGRLSYAELDLLRRRVAASVRRAGVGSGQAVGVLAARHVALPALLLGVLTAGARWAILDPAHPGALLQRQAAAAEVVALLCGDGTSPLPGLPQIIPTDDTLDDDPADEGYLSFTSGTTGDPKPVLTPARPLAHFVEWYRRRFELTADDRFCLLSGLAHDPALRDLFTPLTLGARLAVPYQNLLRDPLGLVTWLCDEQITVAHLTPQLARLMTGRVHETSPTALRLIALAGDAVTRDDVVRLRALAPRARVVVFYGATETPQAHAFHEVGPDNAVWAGRGIDGSQVLIADPAGRLAAVGELGEVLIRSRHLATGYLDEELTSQRFRQAGPDPDDRIYRTGDLGRYRPDGGVELAGRLDDQVKIRGYRVELGEVEAALLGHPAVRACAIAAHRQGPERIIRAYAVPADPDARPGEILEDLRTTLPEYAVPATLTLLTAIPLTPNGKVDRAALPRPDLRPRGPAEPLSATERTVAEVWRSVLGLMRVGAHDNFFEIGGHSLAITAVQARLSERLGREIPIVELFRHPNIHALGRYLDGDRPGSGLDQATRRAAARRARARRTPGGTPS